MGDFVSLIKADEITLWLSGFYVVFSRENDRTGVAWRVFGPQECEANTKWTLHSWGVLSNEAGDLGSWLQPFW